MAVAEILKPYLQIALQQNDFAALELLSRIASNEAAPMVKEVETGSKITSLEPVSSPKSVSAHEAKAASRYIPQYCDSQSFRELVDQEWPEDVVLFEYGINSKLKDSSKQLYGFPRTTLLRLTQMSPGLETEGYAVVLRNICNTYRSSLFGPIKDYPYPVLQSPWDIFRSDRIPLSRTYQLTIGLPFMLVYQHPKCDGGPQEYTLNELYVEMARLMGVLPIRIDKGAARDAIYRRLNYMHLWGLVNLNYTNHPNTVRTSTLGYSFMQELSEWDRLEDLKSACVDYLHRYTDKLRTKA